MQLLFEREQVSGARAPKFKLKAKIDVDETEKAIIAHYRLDKAMLISKFEPFLMKLTAYAAGGSFLLALLMGYSLAGFGTGVFLGLCAAGGAGLYIWNKYRETIFVSNLLHGRYFECRSIVDLAKKEAYLNSIVVMLRQVMESARHWHGVQAHDVPVLPPDEARQFVVKFG